MRSGAVLKAKRLSDLSTSVSEIQVILVFFRAQLKQAKKHTSFAHSFAEEEQGKGGGGGVLNIVSIQKTATLLSNSKHDFCLLFRAHLLPTSFDPRQLCTLNDLYFDKETYLFCFAVTLQVVAK